MRAFFAGRFQPFHRGHQRFVEAIADEAEEVILGVGSAQESHTLDNPFTAGERISMIQRTVESLDATTFVVPIWDIESHAMWVPHVRLLCPPFDVAYTNNPLVDRLFREAGVEVRSIDLVERERFRGTEIRRRIREDEEWQHLVPAAVEGVVDDVEGVERLRCIDATDAVAE